MTEKVVEISIFGAEQICASCVNLPSSIETYEWLQAAISRKFPNQPFNFTYTDIFQPSEDEEKKQFAQRVIDEDLFWPVTGRVARLLKSGILWMYKYHRG